MRERGTLVQMEDRQEAAGRTQSSSFVSYGTRGFLPVSQEGTVST